MFCNNYITLFSFNKSIEMISIKRQGLQIPKITFISISKPQKP